jgi:thiosulfate/3-mercaptopyruvate sulfurtransferase
MTTGSYFASTDWLAAHLDAVVVVDARPPFFHVQGHIPNAVSLPLFSVAGAAGFAEAIASAVGRAGISRDSPLVLYDDGASPTASHLALLLREIGHASIGVLNGGITKWARDGFDVDYSPVELPSVDYGSPPAVAGLTATAEDVLTALDDPGSVIVDVRHPSEYLGVRPTARRNGHIPGAVNIDWSNNLQSEEGVARLRSPEELRQLYETARVTPDKNVILHCQSGNRSTFTWLVLKELGYEKVLNYASGWQEWGNRLDTPVEQA